MDNAVLRDQMGQKAAKRAEDFYCDKVLDQWMHLFALVTMQQRDFLFDWIVLLLRETGV